MGAVTFSLDEKLLELLRRELPLRRFVETGTFEGETLEMACRHFSECHSVEQSDHYYRQCLRRFEGRAGVHLYQGESSLCLRQVARILGHEPALFWLDAHWCVAEHTAGAGSQSPLLAELSALGRLHSESAVLIDDARLYLCAPPRPHRLADWPDFHAVVQGLMALSDRHRLMVCNDVILFYPERLRGILSEFAQEHGLDWLKVMREARKERKRRNRARGWRRFFGKTRPG